MESQLRWEEVACPLCGAQREEVFLIAHAFGDPEGPLHRVVRCQACGLGYLNPRPTEDTIGLLYHSEYKPYQPRRRRASPSLRDRLQRLALSHHQGYPPLKAPWYERALARLVSRWVLPGDDSQTAIPYVGHGRLLDYGCGAGWFLHRMQRRGWHVTGMEMNAFVARRVSDTLGVPVLAGTLPHPALPAESFDVVNLGAVLEHVHDPNRVLAAAARLLAPGGLLVVSVPNLASAPCRWFGENWFSLDLPFHLLHFTPATLRALIERHGLVIDRCRQIGRSSWMRRSLRAAARRSWLAWLVQHGPLPSWLTRYTQWRGQAESLLVWARKPARAAQSRAA